MEHARLILEHAKLSSEHDKLSSEHEAVKKDLNDQTTKLKSELAHLKHLQFGRKSEKTSSSENSGNTTRPPSNRKRGHQPGVPGSGRTIHNNLPVVDEYLDLPVDEQCCSICRQPFRTLFNQTGCDVLEVEVKSYVRRYHRKHYQKTCQCPQTPHIIAPPTPPRLINRGKLGVSFWVELLLNKYAYGMPINRQIESYKTQGLDLYLPPLPLGKKR